MPTRPTPRPRILRRRPPQIREKIPQPTVSDISEVTEVSSKITTALNETRDFFKGEDIDTDTLRETILQSYSDLEATKKILEQLITSEKQQGRIVQDLRIIQQVVIGDINTLKNDFAGILGALQTRPTPATKNRFEQLIERASTLNRHMNSLIQQIQERIAIRRPIRRRPASAAQPPAPEPVVEEVITKANLKNNLKQVRIHASIIKNEIADLMTPEYIRDPTEKKTVNKLKKVQTAIGRLAKYNQIKNSMIRTAGQYEEVKKDHIVKGINAISEIIKVANSVLEKYEQKKKQPSRIVFEQSKVNRALNLNLNLITKAVNVA